MKANELRIGNLVLDNVGLPLTMTAGYFGNTSWIEPIPLTEEWLLKFRFVLEQKKPNVYTKYGLQFRVWENTVVSFIDSRRDHRQIYTVHQLQNLYFALTGKELIIN